MGLFDTINLLKNGYFSTDTSITGSCSLRNDGKSVLAGGLVVEGNLTATAAQTIDFSGNVPRCNGVPTNGYDLVNKTYVDSSFHPIGSYVDLTTNQTVGGVKTFTSNLVAQASTGDVFQAFKNSAVGNAGRVIINSSGDLLYFDAVTSLSKWKLDPDGLLTTTGGLTATATQSINFGANVPTSSGTPTTGNNLINKTYADANYHPIGSYVDLTTNQTVGGVKSFTNNLRAIATSGDVFQAFKNAAGNGGHILVNGSGDLLYYDSTALATKWKLDPSGNFDLTGTMISKTTGTGDFIRSNSNATNYFYASNTGNIGFANSASNIGVNWYINSDGNARFKSSTNSFKYWDINSNLFRYYNLGGINSILMNGDSGDITTTGTFNGNFNYGTSVLRVGTTGTYSQKSIAIGTTSFGTATQSIAIGDQALNASGSTANYSVAIGVNSLKLATGERNTAIGTDSLPLLTGTGNGANTAIGNLTGTKLTSGVNNLFLGLGSGAGVTSGTNNLIVGSSMFQSISPDTGTAINNNVCVGSNAMGYIKNNMSNNCAIGAYALYAEAGYGGVSTVAIGPNAGVRSLGSYCTFIGDTATVSPANSTFNRSIGLGYNATVTASDQVVIATSSQNTLIPGTLTVSGNTTGSYINSTGNIDATGDISATGGLYGYVASVDFNMSTGKGLELRDVDALIAFTGTNAGIRVGVGSTTLIDTTANNINIGNNSIARGGENVVIGYLATGGDVGGSGATKGQGTVQVGAYAESFGEYSVGVGHNTTSYVEGIAIGRNAVAQAQGIAIGKDSNAGQATNISIGYLASTPFTSSVAIGVNVTTTAVGQIAIGSSTSSLYFNQNYFPFEVSPTAISGSTTISPPFYGVYNITATATTTITISGLTAGTNGIQMLFRKTVSTVGTNITCGAGFTYFPFNSVTATAAGVSTAFIGTGQTVGRIAILNATQFMVAH